MHPLGFSRWETAKQCSWTQLSYHYKQTSLSWLFQNMVVNLSKHLEICSLHHDWWISLSKALCCFNCPALMLQLFPLYFLRVIWHFPKRIFIWSFFCLKELYSPHTLQPVYLTVSVLIYIYHFKLLSLFVVQYPVVAVPKIFQDMLVLHSICL